MIKTMGRVMVWAGLAVMMLLPSRVLAVCSTNAEGCVECGPHWGSWSGTCPTVVSNGSVNPTQICQSPGTAPTQPTVVPPVYNTTTWTQTGTYDCTNTISTNTTTVSYTVGSVQWVPPLPGTLTNAFSSTAYVPVSSSDTNKCPSPGLVAVGSCSWCVSFKTTNCASPGNIQFTNVVVNPTNVCIGDPISATANKTISNATVVVTTTCPCSTNPPTSVTNFVAPTIVSNWWTVSGPGSFTASGSGPTANFTPTNGGNGTVTLYLKYQNNIPCDTNPATISISGSFNVIQITNTCVSLIPTNRGRTTIGVGEEVNLELVGSPSGTYTWSTSAGSVNPTSGPATTLTAPSNAVNATVTVSFPGGSCNKAFTVIAPNGILGTNINATSFATNSAAAGMRIDNYLLPLTVSFYRVNTREVPVTTNLVCTGYYTNYPAPHDAARGAGGTVGTGQDNYNGTDNAQGAGYTILPWSAGTKVWPVPVAWWIPGGPTNVFTSTDQTFTITASGTVSVNKFGHTVTRTTNNVITVN